MLDAIQRAVRIIGALVMLAAAVASQASASATLLLEEPYGKLGFFTATGHAAVYLSDVCADSPLVLRSCQPGEAGIVLSRYDGVGRYDWVAIPLIPYLYAVERADDVPLFTDPKMVAFLRDQYRRKYLESVAPDLKNGETPGGNWYELVGTSYDRTVYGFEIETTHQQDAALIRKLNSSPNRSHFRTVSNNCADFAKDVINFYYPKALHRSLVADVGITTPKQMAKRLVKYSSRHPKLHFVRIVIPQVPGTVPRSTAVHGVVESFFKSKKYIVPSAVVSPIFAGCVAGVFVATGTDHFDPARGALVFSLNRNPEPPLGREDRRAYQKLLESFLAKSYATSGMPDGKAWGRLQSSAVTELDDQGRPILQVQLGEKLFSVGASAGNIFAGSAPPDVMQRLLAARLQAELRRTRPPSVSQSDVARDWNLLLETIPGHDLQLSSRALQISIEPQATLSGLAHSGGNLP